MGGRNGSDADDEGLGLDWSPPLEELTEEQRRQYLASGGTVSVSGRGGRGVPHPGSDRSGAAGSGSGSTAATLRHQHDLQQQPEGRDAFSGGEPASSSSRTDLVHQAGGVGPPSAPQASTSAASEGPASSHATAPAAAAARGSSGGGGGGRSLFAAARAAATAALDTEAERMRKEASAVFGERWAHKVKRLPAGCSRHVLPHVLHHVSLRLVLPHVPPPLAAVLTHHPPCPVYRQVKRLQRESPHSPLPIVYCSFPDVLSCVLPGQAAAAGVTAWPAARVGAALCSGQERGRLQTGEGGAGGERGCVGVPDGYPHSHTADG